MTEKDNKRLEAAIIERSGLPERLRAAEARVASVEEIVAAAIALSEEPVMMPLSTDEPPDAWWDALGRLRAAIADHKALERPRVAE